MIITFDTSMSADETLDAIEEIRGLTNEQCLLSGMSAVVTDIKKICNSEVIMYVVIAADYPHWCLHLQWILSCYRLFSF